MLFVVILAKNFYIHTHTIHNKLIFQFKFKKKSEMKKERKKDFRKYTTRFEYLLEKPKQQGKLKNV